ncbi:hypothetical protein NDU88_001553 [Pleurodeles waltl]|uniref:Uncharacterized protein n=1 Tax=Pleurodeles waltl TaxID=8319 RepID=A0AAV7WPP4_PLEWA|nr:hypothetical protein NDU88_001553 [Pleurodeles waltl]
MDANDHSELVKSISLSGSTCGKKKNKPVWPAPRSSGFRWIRLGTPRRPRLPSSHRRSSSSPLQHSRTPASQEESAVPLNTWVPAKTALGFRDWRKRKVHPVYERQRQSKSVRCAGRPSLARHIDLLL